MKDKSETFNRAIAYAYKLLSYRARSKKEITDRFKRKGFNSNIIKKVVKYLEKLDYINDEEFARFWIRMRLSAKPCGVSLLYYELKNKGIDKNIIDKVIEEISSDYDEEKTALKLAYLYYNKINIKDKTVIKRRLFGYLKRRGFKYSVIYDAINELFKKNNSYN